MTEPTVNWAKFAWIDTVVDGDTYIMLLDQGFGDRRLLDVRLRGIDVYEKSTPVGQQATQFVKQLLIEAHEIVVQSYKTKTGADNRSFARYVCDVWVDGANLADLLRTAGYNKPAGQEHLG